MKATVFNGKPSGPPAGLDSKKGLEPGAHIRTSRVPVLSLPCFTLFYLTTILPICFFRCR